MDDLTNYVYAVVNTGSSPAGYTNALAAQMHFSTAAFPTVAAWSGFLTNGANIIGLLTTPEYTDPSTAGDVPGQPALSGEFGATSNHIAAFVRAMSGLAATLPPQDSAAVVGDSFAYRVLCVNSPVPVQTDSFSPLWTPKSYRTGDKVFYNWGVLGQNLGTTEPT